MNLIFNFGAAAAATLAVLLGFQPWARADQIYFTPRQVLAEFFPKSEKVTFVKVTPDPRRLARIKQRLGYLPSKPTYTFYVAKTAGQVDGYAFVDDELGQHLPITYAVKLDWTGKVQDLAIMVYRESRGDEIRDARFRKQFTGKTGSDKVRLNQDVVAISGATISSNSMAIGVRRAVVLFDECMASPATAGKATGTPANHAVPPASATQAR
ncbi:MAG: FMN-binding protein [Deltaproteobacteria bacterium]|nr:FMN-binding protein [Deltaproteobacteria bacterium]